MIKKHQHAVHTARMSMYVSVCVSVCSVSVCQHAPVVMGCNEHNSSRVLYTSAKSAFLTHHHGNRQDV